jgi:hypothetical protein
MLSFSQMRTPDVQDSVIIHSEENLYIIIHSDVNTDAKKKSSHCQRIPSMFTSSQTITPNVQAYVYAIILLDDNV